MKNVNDLFDISAEFLLNYLYPESADCWQVDCAGTFYRNYRPDILSVDAEHRVVRLARDSFLRLLPQGVIAQDNALKGKDFEQKYERLKKREELLLDLFRPVDMLAFRSRLHVERQAAQLLHEKTSFLLKRYFRYDIEKEGNPYIRKTAPLLLLVNRLRADFGFIRNLLELLFDCEVEMKAGRYSWEEGVEYTQPAVEYQLIVPRLTAEAYDELIRAIGPFREFICEWFIPFDTYCTIAVKHHDQPFVLGGNLILDYNTEIGVPSSNPNKDS